VNSLTILSAYIGWFVRYTEVDGNVYVFAANITDSGPQAKGSKARGILLDQIVSDNK
jgi:beta-lactamase class D